MEIIFTKNQRESQLIKLVTPEGKIYFADFFICDNGQLGISVFDRFPEHDNANDVELTADDFLVSF